MAKLILFLVFISSGTLSFAKEVKGSYKCSGSAKKADFTLNIKNNGAFELKWVRHRKDGTIVYDTESGKNYNSDFKLITSSVEKRERIVKRDNIVVNIISMSHKIKLDKGLKSIPKLKKGLKFSGEIERVEVEKFSKKTKNRKSKFKVTVKGQEVLSHDSLGKIPVWNVSQVININYNKSDVVKWDLKIKYNSEYGILEYKEVDYLNGKEVNQENCRLVTWK